MNKIKYLSSVVLANIKYQLSKHFIIRNIAVAGIFVIVLIIGFFIFCFKDQYLSYKLEDWAFFGDFIGGILNPVLTILSLILLGYITILVSRNSAKENKNHFYLQKKNDAFEKINFYLPFFINFENSLKNSITDIDNKYNLYRTMGYDNFIIKWVEEDKFNLIKHLVSFNNFYNTLLGFKVSYSHFFTYFEYKDVKFKNLIEKANILHAEINSLNDKITDINYNKHKCLDAFAIFVPLYDEFLRSIKSELRE